MFGILRMGYSITFGDIFAEYCASPLYSRYDDLYSFRHRRSHRPTGNRSVFSIYFEWPPHAFFLYLRKLLSHPALIILTTGRVIRMRPHQRREERRGRRRS